MLAAFTSTKYLKRKGAHLTKVPGVESAEFEEAWQKIQAALVFEDDLDLDPKLVKHLFVNNVIQRTLSRLYGQSAKGPVAVKCTDDGSLAVVQRGGAFDDYQRLDHPFAADAADRTTDGTTADHLIDASENFPALGVQIGFTVKNVTDTTYALVTAVANGDLTLDNDIIITGEVYQIIPFKEFQFAQQVNRVDLFTYLGDVDYQLTRDLVKGYGDKIELFTDSFYSLDFYTLRVKATAITFDSAAPSKSKVVGWFREGG
jgi:hypothetical protein